MRRHAERLRLILAQLNAAANCLMPKAVSKPLILGFAR